MATIHNITTADELLRHASDLGRCELVRGELTMMSPSGFDHSVVVAAITELLRAHVRKRRLGIVAGAEGGYYLERNPDTVRAPTFRLLHRVEFRAASDRASSTAHPTSRSKSCRPAIALPKYARKHLHGLPLVAPPYGQWIPRREPSPFIEPEFQ